MAASGEEPKTYLTLKRKTSQEKQPFSSTTYAVEDGADQKQASSSLDMSRTTSDFDTVQMGGSSPPPKRQRLFVTVDADGNQVQVEVPHNALPEGVNPDDNNSYIVNADDINLDLSSYSYSVVVDGIVEDVELNDCQYSVNSEDPVKLVKQTDLGSESDEHDIDESKNYIFAEPDDGDPLFKSHYRMSRIVASVSISCFSNFGDHLDSDKDGTSI